CPSYYKPRPPRKSKPKPKTISSNEQLVQDLHSVQKTVNVIASYIIPDPNLLASIPSRALPAIVSANPLHAADSMSSLAALPAQSFPLPTVDVFQLPGAANTAIFNGRRPKSAHIHQTRAQQWS
ncbi:hypothetical protein MPER_01824, partial [Moniliophthora perniciosa FA553]